MSTPVGELGDGGGELPGGGDPPSPLEAEADRVPQGGGGAGGGEQPGGGGGGGGASQDDGGGGQGEPAGGAVAGEGGGQVAEELVPEEPWAAPRFPDR
jgi:hypothetical protein